MTIGTPEPELTTIITSTGDKRCRTKSIDRILHDTPGLLDAPISYAISQQPSSSDLAEYLQRIEIDGYGEGAIVVPKWQRTEFAYLYPHQWGLIYHIHKHPVFGPWWGPLQIKWGNNETEGSWAEDLYVIHACLSKNLICDILEAQGAKIDKLRETVQKLKAF